MFCTFSGSGTHALDAGHGAETLVGALAKVCATDTNVCRYFLLLSLSLSLARARSERPSDSLSLVQYRVRDGRAAPAATAQLRSGKRQESA